MTWVNDAVQALRKIILIEDRMTSTMDDIKKLTERMHEVETRVIKLEAKFEVYENLSKKFLPRP